jgi:probable HAF family extracellular repeat protein
MIMKLHWTELFVTILVAGTTSLLAQNYSITDLGAVPGQRESAGYGLNVSGEAAGVSSSPGGDIPTLFSGGQAINLGTLKPMDIAVATCINGFEDVAGYEPETSSSPEVSHAFVYSAGKLFDIDSPSLFPSGTMAEGINDSGEVVGEGLLNNSSFHAFLYANGKMVDIGPPGAYQASAVAINNNGQIVGNAYFTGGGGGAFLYANGTFTYLAPPAGASVSASSLNSVGQVAGSIYTSSGTHAAVYASGHWKDLGGVTGAALDGTGINAAGQVVATAIFPIQSYHPFRPGKHVGYVIGSNGPINLNTLIPAGSGYTITDAIAINNAGQILCDASSTASIKHAVLLSPK